jgi:hypothetical protein
MNAEPYTLRGPCRRPAGKYVLRPLDGRDGMKGRASFLADNLGGRWSGQAGGYVLSAAAAEKFKLLYAAGFTGGLRLYATTKASFDHEGKRLCGLTDAAAVRLARDYLAEEDVFPFDRPAGFEPCDDCACWAACRGQSSCAAVRAANVLTDADVGFPECP